MPEIAAPTNSNDAAWASFKTPLDKNSLLVFCQDVDRLFRINPYLEFTKWQAIDDDRYQFQARNLSHNPPTDIELELQVEPQLDGVRIKYDRGLKSSTTFKIEAVPEGTQLTIIEDYDRVDEKERETRLDEVDKSLVKWAEDIQAYLIRWKRWSKFTPWRWYMTRVWQPMKPSARRITYMLLWISLVEVTLIALGVAIYFVEFR